MNFLWLENQAVQWLQFFKISEIECGLNSGLNAHSGSPEGLL